MSAPGFARLPRRVLGSALLSAAAVVLSGVVVPAHASGAVRTAVAGESSSSVRSQVKAMQAEVEKASHDLAKGTLAWEAGRARLDLLLQQQFAADRAAEVTAEDVQAAQQKLNAVANAAYRNPVPTSLSMLMSLDLNHLTRSLEMVHVLGRARSSEAEVLTELQSRLASADELAGQREHLRQRAQSAEQALDAQLVELQTMAAQTNARLQAAQARLEAARAREQAREMARKAAEAARAGRAFTAGRFGAGCSTPADGLYANGFLPDSVLCALGTAPGQRLAGPAAAAFDAMSNAYRAAIGTSLCVTDSYRDYGSQVAVFAAKPSLAATPGSSQHGWGMAVDLCGGVERFGGEAHRWMQEHAPTFGFIHPAWAEPGGSRPEAWHWEFVG
ncbi:MAG: D-alanyl-D-alanine carboxypeptidase family protein [Frankiaceae bacterium]|nr:D-alanyl-D-alanine carboxypeptidase family protein [Frankiaceae bacterium]